jgi:hypothetical protein
VTGAGGGGKGIAAQRILKSITQRPGETLEVKDAWSYRAEMRNRVAVELRARNTGPLPWTA